jgi:DNA-binding SARP family transcriptional activator/tetratricopeptide (TPR) repeat protein
MLSFHFLGAPRLEIQDARGTAKRIELDTRKAIALAAYLALTPQAHERDELAAFLYPDTDTSHARAALRRTLSTLKTALGENILEIERETLALHRTGVQVDVLEFRALAQQNTPEALTRAAQLYQGDFLAGFTLRDSPAFDEWQFFETESLRKQFAAVLEQLVAQESAQHKYKRGIEYARRWLALDPLHEPAHRALMLLYARDGQRAAALRQYQECVRQLDQELGVAPLPETTELYRAIQENRATKDEGRRTDGEGRTQTARVEQEQRYPFVGRTRELATLIDAYSEIAARGLSSASGGHSSAVGGRLLIIQGEAGIGKTRLAEEFLTRVGAQGAKVLAARNYVEQRSLAYAPFVQALQAAMSDARSAARLDALSLPVLADAARLVPELAPDNAPPALYGVGGQARFFDAIAQVILKLAGDAPPGILFLDDAQWLDEASLDLLAFLIRRLKNAPLCILLTWRAQEITNDHTLRRLYADALREERATLVSLSRLAKPDVQTLVNFASERGAPIHAQLAERIYRETEGQPFFLIEALKLIEREGQLPEGDALPATVRELLHSRLARVSETALQLLSAAAVIGHSFDFEILDRVSGRSEQETVQGLEELAAQGLIVEETQVGAPRYDFTHEKLRALVYGETSLARRRLLHRRTAEALMQATRGNASGSEGQIAGQIAHHLRAGGDETRAAEFYKRAGDYARSVFANRDAVENYTAALALGLPDAAALHTSIGDAQTLLGEYDAALASYETGAAFGAKDADAHLARVYLRRGEWERAAHHLENALALTKKSAAQALLYADLALVQHQSHKDAEALKQAKRALALAQKGKDTRALAQVHNILGILARTRGQSDTARKHLEASRTLAEKDGDVSAHAAALNNLALVAHATRDDAGALELTQRALELVTRAGDRHRQAALHNHLADVYHALGREADSMAELKCAVAIYAEIGGPVGAWQPEIWKLEEW